MKKSLYILSLLVFVFSFNISSAFFSDVPASHKYFKEINFLDNNLFLGSESKYRPDDNITRLELIEYLIRYTELECKDPGLKNPYKDISDDNPKLPYVLKSYELGISPLSSNFSPDRKINRFEMIKTILYLEGIPTPKYNKDSIKYTDINPDSYYMPFVKKAIELNLIKPHKNNTLGLFQKVTKGEFAYALYNLIIYKQDYDFYLNKRDKKITIKDNTTNRIPKSDILDDVYDAIINNHVSSNDLTEKDKEDLIYSAIKGMVKYLGDKHTQFLSPEEADALRITLNNELEGIGAYLNKDDDNIFVVAPIKGSPADKAGIEAGDIILSINGESTKNMSVHKAVNLIQGESGSIVKLEIKRDDKNIFFEVKREKINVSSVILEMDEDNIAHIIVTQFSSDTNKEFKKTVEEIKKIRPKGIILDFRNNPGGYLDSAVNMLSYFLNKNEIAVIVKYSNNSNEYKSLGFEDLKNYKTVVMGNKGTASAAEIVMGTLIETLKTPFVGTKTYGKGTVQELNYFDDGSSLKLTIAKWLTPDGIWFDHNGINPNYEISDNPKTKEIDEAYEKAKEVLMKK